MTSGYVLIMALHLITGGNNRPDTLVLKETTIVCSEIISTVSREGYKYVGFQVKSNKEYLTKHTDLESLQKEIDRQCK